MIEKIDAVLDSFLTREFILEEDVAWIALTKEQIACLPGDHFICPIRSVECVVYRDVEFRFSPWARDHHKIYPVWDITKRTKPLFNKQNQNKETETV